MVVEKDMSDRQSGGSGGDDRRSTLELESLARIDMKKMSQSELYSLSRCSSSAFDLKSPDNLVIPKIESDHRSTASITTIGATPSRIFAFSHRRCPRYRRRISASQNEDADQQLTENRFILNSLEKLVAEGVVNDSNTHTDMAPVENEGVDRKRKRKRKSRAAEENGVEFEGLGVITVNGEDIDLKFLARVADGAFEAELNKMMGGMVREDEFLGFLKGLEGRWGSSRKRRKYVDASNFLKALPTNWQILLSLRPRARRPSLYCRRYVSPTGIHFKSCKEAAFYLKSQLVANVANPPQEGAMMHIESDCPVDLETETDPVADTATDRSGPRRLIEAQRNDSSLNGQGSPSLAGPSDEPKSNPEVKGNFKTRCMWCLDIFFREPVDAETLANSSGFICPKCKEEISGRLESTLARLYLANK